MPKFYCAYADKDDEPVAELPPKDITATDKESAASLYAQKFPSEHPRILLSWGLFGAEFVDNPSIRIRQEEGEIKKIVEKANYLHQQKTVLVDGKRRLGDLTYEEFQWLVEFMWKFPAIREDLNAEARATGEELYMMTLFDRALQAGLQTIILNQIATGQTTTGSTVTGKSTLARNAAMLGGMAALQKLDDIEENTEEVSEGLGFD
ncbi:hypothetical protein N9965_01445 [bacterium]|nr:hypothetical protein [Akkermansiaceae bacterium]MDB4311080.1 hypothetical protein [bacterium]MDB4327679.1 hypothetical protein [bacterium]